MVANLGQNNPIPTNFGFLQCCQPQLFCKYGCLQVYGLVSGRNSLISLVINQHRCYTKFEETSELEIGLMDCIYKLFILGKNGDFAPFTGLVGIKTALLCILSPSEIYCPSPSQLFPLLLRFLFGNCAKTSLLDPSIFPSVCLFSRFLPGASLFLTLFLYFLTGLESTMIQFLTFSLNSLLLATLFAILIKYILLYFQPLRLTFSSSPIFPSPFVPESSKAFVFEYLTLGYFARFPIN
jgi:hypothetical protein